MAVFDDTNKTPFLSKFICVTYFYYNTVNIRNKNQNLSKNINLNCIFHALIKHKWPQQSKAGLCLVDWM